MPKLEPHHYFPRFPRIRDKLSWKMSTLVTCEIFTLFLNTLTPDDNHSRGYMQILWQQLPTPLSQKENTFCQFLIAFLNFAWNLEHSEKREEYPTLITTEVIASERDVYLSV